MNDKHYLEKMIALTEELERAASVRPYDPDVYNDVLARITALHMCWYHSRRRRPWGMYAILFVVCLIFAWVVYDIIWAL